MASAAAAPPAAAAAVVCLEPPEPEGKEGAAPVSAAAAALPPAGAGDPPLPLPLPTATGGGVGVGVLGGVPTSVAELEAAFLRRAEGSDVPGELEAKSPAPLTGGEVVGKLQLQQSQHSDKWQQQQQPSPPQQPLWQQQQQLQAEGEANSLAGQSFRSLQELEDAFMVRSRGGSVDEAEVQAAHSPENATSSPQLTYQHQPHIPQQQQQQQYPGQGWVYPGQGQTPYWQQQSRETHAKTLQTQQQKAKLPPPPPPPPPPAAAAQYQQQQYPQQQQQGPAYNSYPSQSGPGAASGMVPPTSQQQQLQQQQLQQQPPFQQHYAPYGAPPQGPLTMQTGTVRRLFPGKEGGRATGAATPSS
ncbi:unnamed protein product [Polarella glacialis]|uniref:Uncharacterized protein n=1 Tax=Polarella glacialis TaxID=89957 RepID=A0A813GF74_POLGL|nr:unnamed protein product [Polarella glacialis]